MKKKILNTIGAILMFFSATLILCEYEFTTNTELLYFILTKIIGFFIGYAGYNLIDFKD